MLSKVRGETNLFLRELFELFSKIIAERNSKQFSFANINVDLVASLVLNVCPGSKRISFG